MLGIGPMVACAAMRRVPLVLLFLLAVLALAGCSASVSVGGIDSEEVAEEAQAKLSKVSEERGGAPFPTVHCPDDLNEEKGSTMTCFANFDGERHKISVEVTKVEDENAELHFEADALPTK
jgi:hypothetical protein